MSTVAEKYGRSLICVVMLSERNEKFYDTAELLRHGFEDFQTVSLPASFFATEMFTGASDFSFLLRSDLRVEDVYVDDYPASLPTGSQPVPVSVRIGDGILLGMHEIIPCPEAETEGEAIPSWLAYPSEDAGESGGGIVVLLWLLGLGAAMLIIILIRRLRNR
jgi:hypothetical protein